MQQGGSCLGTLAMPTYSQGQQAPRVWEARVAPALLFQLVEERWPVKRQETPADQNGHPHAQGRAGDDLRAQWRLCIRPQRLELAKGARAIERQHIEAGHNHEQGLQSKCIVVEVLVGVSDEEDNAGKNVHQVSSDSPRYQPVNGLDRNSPDYTRHPKMN